MMFEKIPPVSRKEALALGSKYYFTGKYCHRWHMSNRFTICGACVDCKPIDKAKHILTDKFKQTSRNNYIRNKHKWRNRRLKSVYKISEAEYDLLAEKQNNLCAICGKKETRFISGKAILSIDHCHKNKRIRALLCNNCNKGLGNFKDDISAMMNAIFYLKEHE